MNNFLWTAPFIFFMAGYFIVGLISHNQAFDAPNLVGMQLHEACSTLAARRLNFKLKAEKIEPDLPSGTILSQTPRAQQKIRRNQTVSCVVSTLPAIAPCPQLTGKTEQEVTQITRAAMARNRSYYLPSTQPKHRCIAQWPRTQQPLDAQTTITYFSDGNTAPIIMPDVTKFALEEVIDFLRSNNMEPEITYAQERGRKHQQEHVIVDQRPLAGSILYPVEHEVIRVQLQVQ